MKNSTDYSKMAACELRDEATKLCAPDGLRTSEFILLCSVAVLFGYAMAFAF